MTANLPSWEAAACRDHDPDLFFPVGDGELSRRQEARARAVCARCAITEVCLRWALEQGIPDGVWGGRTAAQRRGLRATLAVGTARAGGRPVRGAGPTHRTPSSEGSG